MPKSVEEKKWVFRLNEHADIEFTGNPRFISHERGNNDFNLKRAKKNGIEPISFSEIIELKGKDFIENSVLSDNPNDPLSVGGGINRFRLIKDHPESNQVTLQPCKKHGGYDGELMPFTISRSFPIFTGLSFQEYRRGENLVPLFEVVKQYKDLKDSSTHWISESIFLSRIVDDTKQLIQV